MIEKIGPVRNPLTIIAMFAALAELSGTGILPFISSDNQRIYIWFLMLFPAVLVGLFFYTLNFNHEVLYAPSDFRDEENFFKSVSSASSSERLDKLKNETRDTQFATDSVQSVGPSISTGSTQHATTDLRARYLLAEELVLDRLSKELKIDKLVKDARFRGRGNANIIFDGVFKKDNTVFLVEIMYVPDISRVGQRFQNLYQKILSNVAKLPESGVPFSMILAVVTDTEVKDEGLEFVRKTLEKDQFRLSNSVGNSTI